MITVLVSHFFFCIAEKRRIYDNRGSAFDDNYAYDNNPFAGFAFHNPEDIFAEVFNHMNGMFGMGPPPSLFGGFHQPQPPFMPSPFGMMMDPFQHSMNTNFSFSSSSSGGMRGGGFSSKSVSTSTRIVNGVVETIKVTKITDENVKLLFIHMNPI